MGPSPQQRQLRQALIPSGASVVPNPVGSAPGFWLSWRGTLLISLPGVPGGNGRDDARDGCALCWRLDRGEPQPQPIIRRLVFHTWGISEADVDAKLLGLIPKELPVDLGLLASPMGVLVSLTMKPRAAAGEDALVSLSNELRVRLQEWIFAEGQESMEEVVGRLLTRQHRTVALAESCTGGLIGHRLTQVPGSSTYMDRGVICYSNNAKVELLGVSRRTHRATWRGERRSRGRHGEGRANAAACRSG